MTPKEILNLKDGDTIYLADIPYANEVKKALFKEVSVDEEWMIRCISIKNNITTSVSISCEKVFLKELEAEKVVLKWQKDCLQRKLENINRQYQEEIIRRKNEYYENLDYLTTQKHQVDERLIEVEKQTKVTIDGKIPIRRALDPTYFYCCLNCGSMDVTCSAIFCSNCGKKINWI